MINIGNGDTGGAKNIQHVLINGVIVVSTVIIKSNAALIGNDNDTIADNDKTSAGAFYTGK